MTTRQSCKTCTMRCSGAGAKGRACADWKCEGDLITMRRDEVVKLRVELDHLRRLLHRWLSECSPCVLDDGTDGLARVVTKVELQQALTGKKKEGRNP